MVFTNEQLAALPSTFAEKRRKLLLRLLLSKTHEDPDPSIPQYLVDELFNKIVFGEDRILVRPVVATEP